MNYGKVISGTFLSRPNRFIAKVLVDGIEETVHVKNTGRCREMLQSDSKVWLQISDNPNRKTKYDLIAVEKKRTNAPDLLINMDSQAPNDAAAEYLRTCSMFSENAVIRREKTYGKSRFDFYIEDGDRKVFIEVKGVTLENNGIASFPDAPTERGIKHINELTKCLDDGFEAYIFFVIQMKGISLFEPARVLHPEFADTLIKAEKAGVGIIVRDCIITPDSITIDSEIPYRL